MLAAVVFRKIPLDCFDIYAAVVSSYSFPKLFCPEQLQLGGGKGYDGGQVLMPSHSVEADAQVLEPSCVQAYNEACSVVARHESSL